MSLTQIQQIQVNKHVDYILHTPGNQPLGKSGKESQLEMAFVLDCSSNIQYVKETLMDVVSSLKRHDQLFQNVRSNVVYWHSPMEERELETQVMPMSFIQIGKAFEQEAYFFVENHTVFDNLCAYLKVFHARSKCIIVISDGNYKIIDQKKTFESLNPFLKSKLLVITPEKMISGSVINMEMIRQA